MCPVVLNKPLSLISIIRSFHDSMSASFLFPDIAVDPIDARNGRHQGCCMPPVLLNIFMLAVFQLWSRAVKESHEFRVHLCCASCGALLFKKGGDCELSVNVSFLTILHCLHLHTVVLVIPYLHS